MGATIWHGPHHTAQKSTITSSDAFMTSASQVESSTFKASPATCIPSFRRIEQSFAFRHRTPAQFLLSNVQIERCVLSASSLHGSLEIVAKLFSERHPACWS